MSIKLPFSGYSSKRIGEPNRPRITLADEQIEALERMKRFLDTEEPVLVLQGYAGTGKPLSLMNTSSILGLTEKTSYYVLQPIRLS